LKEKGGCKFVTSAKETRNERSVTSERVKHKENTSAKKLAKSLAVKMKVSDEKKEGHHF